MLEELKEKHIHILYNELQTLSEEDKYFFHPHRFDEETLRKLLKDGEHYYIFSVNDKNIGYCFLRTFHKYSIPTLGCVIWKRYRRKNYGYILMQELIKRAKELGYKKLKLKVYHDNKKAFKLYKKCGFEKIEDGDDEIWMELNHL